MHQIAFSFFAVLALHWTPQMSNTTVSLRGLSVVSAKVVWTSGSGGTVLRSLDGGEHWDILKVAGAEALDFRDVVGFDGEAAAIMSSGAGEASRVYVTGDGGAHWKLVLPNPDKNGFFDAMKFWDRQHGMLLGDPVAGHFTIFTTGNGGMSWTKVSQPAALKDEGAFAASGTCLTVLGKQEAWFGSGGPGGGRVFHTADAGMNWRVANTPLSGETASAGIFSLKFIDSAHGIAVGGDYQQPAATARTLALTNYGGQTWMTPAGGMADGFKSAVTYVKREKLLVTVGTTGSDYSVDGGRSWTMISKDSLHAVANESAHVWAVGAKGLILKLAFGK